MRARTAVFGVAVVLVAGAAVAAKLNPSWLPWMPQGAVAQSPRPAQAQRAVPIDIAVAEKRMVPLRIDLLGTVTPVASVSVKTRIDTEIVGVHFRDGAMVQKDDLLFTMDCRAVEAQVRQVEGQLARDKASLEGAERDAKRYTDLVAKSATPIINLDNAKTQVGMFTGALMADQASIDNLKVQLSYCTIRAPIAGRVSMAAVKVGNFVRQADLTPLATIIQTSPVYVTFPLPQRSLSDLRTALRNESANIEAIVPGDARRASGVVTMIENTVDANTGTVPVRATMPNKDELLWPGTLVTVQLIFREQEAVTVPQKAIMASQAGSYVYVVKNGAVTVNPVKISRNLDLDTILESGLEGGETVVTDGQMQLTNGARVAPRNAKAGS